MRIGILKEGKVPPDSRVVLTPGQLEEALNEWPQLSIVVAPAGSRCFSDDEYKSAAIPLNADLGNCDVLLGVKEVPADQLQPGKTYFFFSHTIKAQPYNRRLLQEVLRKQIRLVDYECLTSDGVQRVIAFGRWAGIVGAYNGLLTWGLRTGNPELPRAVQLKDYAELKAVCRRTQMPPVKIVVTGDGRVAGGAVEVLDQMGIRRVDPDRFRNTDPREAVYTQLTCAELYERKTDRGFELSEFYREPGIYQSTFQPYLSAADVFINAVYWDPAAPAFFTLDEMKTDDFRIRVIADITCDIAPESSVPSTIRPSTISDPIYGFDRFEHRETTPFTEHSVDVMAVDNLPNELPRDASESFGRQFIDHVLPELMQSQSPLLDRATIAQGGRLTPSYQYLQDYVDGK